MICWRSIRQPSSHPARPHLAIRRVELTLTGGATMIERDEWLYVYTDTAAKARAFFGLPDDTETRQVKKQIRDGWRDCPQWAVRAPTSDPAKA